MKDEIKSRKMYGLMVWSNLKKQPLPSVYYLHNHKLAPVTKAKYLGVTLDFTLSFNIHVIHVRR